jgi:hypothetical protein
MRRSLTLVLMGGLILIFFSIFQLVNQIRQFFWWSIGVYISGETLIVSALIGIAAALIGVLGAIIGKRLGGVLMIISGVIVTIITPLIWAYTGAWFIIGGISALFFEKSFLKTMTHNSNTIN